MAMAPEEFNILVEAVNSSFALCHKEILTLDEASRYTGMKKSTLYKLTAARVIPHSKPGGKVVYFSRRALEEWMMSNPVATDAELNGQARAYCMMNRIY